MGRVAVPMYGSSSESSTATTRWCWPSVYSGSASHSHHGREDRGAPLFGLDRFHQASMEAERDRALRELRPSVGGRAKERDGIGGNCAHRPGEGVARHVGQLHGCDECVWNQGRSDASESPTAVACHTGVGVPALEQSPVEFRRIGVPIDSEDAQAVKHESKTVPSLQRRNQAERTSLALPPYSARPVQ
jgi:hypothetical protein